MEWKVKLNKKTDRDWTLEMWLHRHSPPCIGEAPIAVLENGRCWLKLWGRGIPMEDVSSFGEAVSRAMGHILKPYLDTVVSRAAED